MEPFTTVRMAGSTERNHLSPDIMLSSYIDFIVCVRVFIGSELVRWKRSQSKYAAEGKRRLEAASVLQAAKPECCKVTVSYCKTM